MVTASNRQLHIPNSFFDNEFLRVQITHLDLLVILVWICNSQVKRVLLDKGSSVDVLFFMSFKEYGHMKSICLEVRNL